LALCCDCGGDDELMPAAAAAIAGEQEVEVAVEPAAFDRQAALISSDLSRMSACTYGEWNCLK